MNVKSKLDYIVNLSKTNFSSIGFIPSPYLEKLIINDQVFFEYEGGLEGGFCVIGSGKGRTLKIYQHCIQEDLRMLKHGKKLFKKIEDVARKRNYDTIHLRVRENLEANKFWKALGFEFMFLEPKVTQRTNKGINHWNYHVSDPKQHLLFGYHGS
jgi:ribosomal protein S18 acetylase RimI-like enzyme